MVDRSLQIAKFGVALSMVAQRQELRALTQQSHAKKCQLRMKGKADA